MKKITVTVNGKPIFADAGLKLSEIIKGDTPCGGFGKCGKCKVVARGNISEPSDVELKLLSDNELVHGVRLACLTEALGDCEIRSLFSYRKAQIITDGVLPKFECKPTFFNYGVAIDIGTTTVAARLYNSRGALLSETTCLNPQSRWGADVVSRINASLNGKRHLLSQTIRNALNDMITEISSAANISTKTIDGVCIVGNTVMLSLLTEESVEPFSHAPFDVKRLFGETLTAKELSLSALEPGTSIYLPPCISAFVGADITCALLATELCDKKTAMLVDIGTNGEMAWWHDNKLTVCSTAAGPAFEGVGIAMGMQGTVGAIDRVSISNGKIAAHVIGDTEPIGICGSGLIDAVACMLDENIIDESGYLEDDAVTIKKPVTIMPQDIRALQLAKSAICAGILTLIDVENLNVTDVPPLYIAGGFGNYLNKESAAKIGLLPKALVKSSHTVGNAALGGAAMLLLNSDVRVKAEYMSKNANVLDLSTSVVFSEYYMKGMTLSEV